MLFYATCGAALIMGVSFAQKGRDRYADFCLAAALPVMIVLLIPLGALTGWLKPVTLDAQLRMIDLALGLDGFALSRFLVRTHLYFLVPLVYDFLPLAIAAAWTIERPRFLLRAIVFGAVFAAPFYLLIPACGPAHAFEGWPLGSAQSVAVDMFHPRNCMPSMHVAWAMLLALNARNRPWKAVLWVYAGLMGIATVAGGEHYFIDVLAAIPFSLGIQWLAGNPKWIGASGAWSVRVPRRTELTSSL